MRGLPAALRLARTKGWVNNVFVVTALIFAGKILDGDAIVKSLIAFAAFCLASSAVYFFNDYKDVDEDRKHPTKKSRPLASGAVPRFVGLIGSVVLVAGSVAIPYFLINANTAVVIAAYLALNFGYSLGLKHLVIIDVLAIAAGFVLRIVAGVTALSLETSTWLILCALSLSLFLGFTKRRAEVVLLGDDAKAHRKVLEYYSTGFLDQMISVVTAATLVVYILYTVDSSTVELVGSRALLLSVPLVIYGIFRYLYLVYHTETSGNPTDTVLSDVPLIITGIIWGILCTVVILVRGEWSSALSWLN